MGLWDLPPRHEGPHSLHGSLVRSEAWRHVAIDHRLLHFRGGEDCKLCGPSGVMGHVTEVENSIHDHLKLGWARYRDDVSGIEFYNPVLKVFQTFTDALLMTWAIVFHGLDALKDADTKRELRDD